MVPDRRPGGHWRIILAACGGLIAASPPGHGTGGEQDHTTSEIASSLRQIDATLQKANETGDLNKPCEREKPERRSQLCAQWQAADQAERSADWARRAFWLAVGGAFLGLLTFGAAAAAAWFAERAAFHTKRSADEAAAATRIASENLSHYRYAENSPVAITLEEKESGVTSVFITNGGDRAVILREYVMQLGTLEEGAFRKARHSGYPPRLHHTLVSNAPLFIGDVKLQMDEYMMAVSITYINGIGQWKIACYGIKRSVGGERCGVIVDDRITKYLYERWSQPLKDNSIPAHVLDVQPSERHR